ncbi:MAG: type II secretion system protein [Sedimentisphaerales bacterium]|nr:type II secretion system protein [Sedimentisphaerales bacterium]
MFKQRRITVTEKGVSKRIGRSANRGFTLVELLVVISIIALLMSILMPALRRVKMQAEEAKCRSNVRQVGIIMFMYLQEEDFKMPDFHVLDPRDHMKCNKHLWTLDGRRTSVRLGPDEDWSYWATAFNAYVKDIDIFGCAAMRQFAELLAKDLMYNYTTLAPEVKKVDIIQTAAYGLNGYIDKLNTNAVKNQAEVVVCTDHVEPRNEQADDDHSGDMFCIGNDSDHWNLSHFREKSDTALRKLHYRGIFRHNIRKSDQFETGGRANVLWLDGAANSIEETRGSDILNRWYDPRGKNNGGWLTID